MNRESIAIIADIHGNLAALDAVLRDIAALGIVHIISNGDMVNRGPHSVAVLERLAEIEATLVLGNHDDLVCMWEERSEHLPQAWFEDPFWDSTAHVSRQLAEVGLLEPLQTLPMTYTLQGKLGAPSVLISHGSPRHYREGYGRHLSEDSISEIIQEYPAGLYIGSHTHRPMRRWWGPHLILNTGAVGTPFNGDPRAQYLVLHLVDGAWRTEFRAVTYDQEATLTAYRQTGFLEKGGLSALMFYEEVRRARAIYAPFWSWTEKQARPRDWESWKRFKAEYHDFFWEPRTPKVWAGRDLQIDDLPENVME